MKKKVLIIFITLFITFSPINIFAQEIIDTSNEFNKLTIDNSIVNFDGSYDYVPEVLFEYNREEQQILDNAPVIGCKAAYVINTVTGKIFYEKNAHERMFPASTTKILSALVVLENCQLTETAIVSQNAVDLVPEGYSDADLQVGEELKIKDLLYALLIPSANEAANVLAEHVSGSISDFADLCNKRAKELGCEDLHFVNPSGIHDDDHYCTAYDLYLIAKECQKYDIFNQIVTTTSFTVPSTEIYPYSDRTFANTNSLIQPASWTYYYPYCTGIKTGYTTPAGECLVASSSHDNIDLISVVLGGETNSDGLNERFYDTKQLLDFVYNNYSYKEIVKKGDVLATVTVDKATKDTSSLDVIVNSSIYTIVPNSFDMNQIPTYISLPDEIEAPVKQFQKMAQVTFKVDGLNYTTDMIASHTVEKIPYWIHNTIVISIILISVLLIILIIWIIIKHRKKSQEIDVFDFTDEDID